MFCSVCDCFSRSDDDYFCCTWDNHIIYSFDMRNLERVCPKKDDMSGVIENC